jgi:hypothetical protein
MTDQNKADDSYSFLADIQNENRAMREADYSLTPEEAKELRARYPKDTPEAYNKIKPEEFFDGAL